MLSDEILSKLPDQVKAVISEYVPHSGANVLVVALVVGIIWLFMSLYKEAITDRIKELLKNTGNFLIITFYLFGAARLLGEDRLLALAALSLAVFGYLFARTWYPSFIARRRIFTLSILGALAVCIVAYAVDIALERRRQARFSIALLLPPDGAPKEPEKLFAGLRNILIVSLNGIKDIRIVPEKLTPEYLSNYTYGQSDRLLTYSTREGRPTIFIRNKFSIIPGTNSPSEAKFRVLITPYQKKGDKLEPIEDWAPRAVPGGQAEMDWISLRTSFELFTFLSSKGLIKIQWPIQEQIWRNILIEYGQFLASNAPNCDVLNKVVSLSTSTDVLSAATVKEVLNATCDEPIQDQDASIVASESEFNTLRVRINPNLGK